MKTTLKSAAKSLTNNKAIDYNKAINYQNTIDYNKAINYQNTIDYNEDIDYNKAINYQETNRVKSLRKYGCCHHWMGSSSWR